ncbi:MAG: PEP-CTERM sorting domain-containing protein [Phycisphaerae bacterium]
MVFNAQRFRFAAGAALLAAVALTSAASADVDILFSEGDFDPGSWSTQTPFLSTPPVPGLTWSVSTDRFIGGDPFGEFILQQFTMDVPAGEFTAFQAPVFFTGFTHDPTSEGAVLSLSASVKTLPVATDASDGSGEIRLWLRQGGRRYALNTSSPNAGANFPDFFGFSMTDPEQTRTAVSLVPEDFMEFVAGVGFDSTSHPNFAGEPIDFGVGYSITTTGKAGAGQTTVVGAFDDVSFRLTAVPEPATLGMLSAAGVAGLLRRRRRAG